MIKFENTGRTSCQVNKIMDTLKIDHVSIYKFIIEEMHSPKLTKGFAKFRSTPK